MKTSTTMDWYALFDRRQDTCAVLQRNDPTVIKIDTQELGGFECCSTQLWQALAGNVHVSNLTLHFRQQFLQYADGTVEVDQQYRDISPLLQYLSQGPALRIVVLRCEDRTAAAAPSMARIFVRSCLQALAQHPLVEELSIGTKFDVPDDDMVRLLQKTTSLRSIKCNMNFGAAVAQAFGNNQTLHTIIFNLYGWESSHPVAAGRAAVLLHHLQSHAGLRHLQFVGTLPEPVDLALSEYLARPECRLTHLTLRMSHFDKQQGRHLLSGLLHHSNQSLTHLSFIRCWYDEASVATMQPALPLSSSSNGNGSVPSKSSLQELYINPSAFPFADQVAALFVLYHSNLQACRLGGDRRRSTGKFWNVLSATRAGRSSTANAAPVVTGTATTSDSPQESRFPVSSRIRTLTLREVSNPSDVVAMLACLPTLRYLQELVFLDDISNVIFGHFARAVRSSGSLRRIVINESFPTFWSDKEGRAVQAALERNEKLPHLLASLGIELLKDQCDKEATPPSTELSLLEQSATAATADQSSQSPGVMDSGGGNAVNDSICVATAPALFLTAMQAPHVAPNSILLGLMGSGMVAATAPVAQPLPPPLDGASGAPHS